MALLASLILSLCLYFAEGVRVCPNLEDYNWILDGECYDNPAGYQNITGVIQSWGFTAEEHYIVTDDGYILLLERAYSQVTKETPVIIVPGMLMNGFGYVHRGNDSLVYVLGSLGYDVWILNYRGVLYSTSHIHLTTKDKGYWSFSVNELGIYDVRSAIKHVHEQTKKKAVYIGYSMGTTSFYIYCTTFPDETKSYIEGMVGMGSVATLNGMKSPFRLFLEPFVVRIAKRIAYLPWNGNALKEGRQLLKPLLKFSLGIYFVQTMMNVLTGFDYDQMDALTYPLLPKWIDTAGKGIYLHYAQIYRRGVLQNYDYGKAKNLKIYGQVNPPVYNLSKILLPVALFAGANDWIASTENAEQLYSQLPVASRCGYHLIDLPKWNHYDFLTAKDIKKYLYQPVISKIHDIVTGGCKP